MPSARKPTPPAKISWLHRIASFLGKTVKPSAQAKKTSRPQTGPRILSKAETALLPPFPGLNIDRIHVPRTLEECTAAAEQILAAGVTGFDTEARPTFRAGEKSTGPHVVQFALTDRAFIFQLHRPECIPVIAELVASESLLKVGFGLRNDHGQIRNRFGVPLHHVLDLDHVFRQRGHRDQIGVRRAIAEVLGQSFPKSKSVTTSNWAAADLTPTQLAYAANDAYAALKIMEALKLDPVETAERFRPRPDRKRRRRRSPSQRRPAGSSRDSS